MMVFVNLEISYYLESLKVFLMFQVAIQIVIKILNYQRTTKVVFLLDWSQLAMEQLFLGYFLL